MSEMINHDPVHAPATFPLNGRWLINPKEVSENYDRQFTEYRLWRAKIAALGGAKGTATCADSLHISLFFDGTGNNEHYDTKLAQPPNPTNIARLYHASHGTWTGPQALSREAFIHGAKKCCSRCRRLRRAQPAAAAYVRNLSTAAPHSSTFSSWQPPRHTLGFFPDQARTALQILSPGASIVVVRFLIRRAAHVHFRFLRP